MAAPCGLALILSLAMCLGVSGSVNPGSVVRITQKGLDYVSQEWTSALQQQLSKVQLSDFTVLVTRDTHYNFSSLFIKSIQFPSSQVRLIPNVGLKLAISWAIINADGQWKMYSNETLSSNGNFSMQIHGLNISTDLDLGSDGQGRPTISSSKCKIHISDINQQFSHPFSWVSDIIHRRFDSKLRCGLGQQLCSIFTDLFNGGLQTALQTLPVTAKLDNRAAIDFSLTGPPVVTAQYLDIPLKGETYDLSNHTRPFFSAPAISFPEDNGLMFYVGVSDYLLNTAGYVYQSAKALVFNVTNDMIPKSFNVALNTSSFKMLIPKISEMYPNMLVKLKISFNATPVLSINPVNLILSPSMDIQAYAVLPNTSVAPLFLLNLRTNIVAKVAINSNKIVGNVRLSRTLLTLKHCDVEPFSVTILNMAVNYFLSNVILPQVNVPQLRKNIFKRYQPFFECTKFTELPCESEDTRVLKEGYPLSFLESLHLQDAVIQPYKNFILFGANIHF